MSGIKPRYDLTGKTFGRWTVVCLSHKDRQIYWRCRCECGTEKAVSRTSLKNGDSRSCGCLRKGGWLSRTESRPTYIVWNAIRQRLYNPKNTSYCGDKGLGMCKEWENDFGAFLRDMGPKPWGAFFRRKDLKKGFYPDNCEWAYSRNDRPQNSLKIKWKGTHMSLADICRMENIDYNKTYRCLNKGMAIDECLPYYSR